MVKSSKPLPDPETLLVDYAERLTHHRAGRKALVIALSALAPSARGEGATRLVDNLLTPLVLRHGGETFRLRNGDVVTIFASADRALTERLTLKLRYMFRDDPLIAAEEKGGEASLCKWFDLVQDYDAFLALSRAIKRHAEDPAPTATARIEARPREAEIRGRPDSMASPLVRWLTAPPVGPRALGNLADSCLAVRQRPGEAPTKVFELLTPRSEAVCALGFPHSDLERNAELGIVFRHLAGRRLLIELHGARKPAEQVAVALDLDVLLGAEFLALHRAWALGCWVPLTLIVPYTSFLEDPKRFRYAREMVRRLGHRLGVGEVPVGVLATRRRMDADLITFSYRPETRAESDRIFADLKQAFLAQSAEDVLLTGVDTREGSLFARALGVTMIAGRQAGLLLTAA